MPPLRFLGPAAAALLLPAAAAAQADPTLLGRWQTRQLAFTVEGPVPDSVLDRLDDPGVADLNQAIFSGEARLEVEFRADSTYDFTIERGGQLFRREAGTFTVRRGHLHASSPGSPDGSSFDDQHLLRLTRRALVLAFPAGPTLPGVQQEVEYRRVR